jgi:nitroreductase
MQGKKMQAIDDLPNTERAADMAAIVDRGAEGLKQNQKSDDAATATANVKDLTSWTPVEEVILKRRSIRAFKSKPLPDFMIRRILEAGRFAPSAGNAQPWKFAVIKSPEIIAAMERDAVKMAKILMWFLDYGRSKFRRIFLKPWTKLIIRFQVNQLHPVPFGLLREIAKGNTPVFHGAPTLILLYEDRRGVSNPATDIGVCGQNMVLAAHSMGAGACWIGLVKLLMYYPYWRKFFNIAFPYRLENLIAVGWPKVKADGAVPREVQLIEWYEGGLGAPPRIERQGT